MKTDVLVTGGIGYIGSRTVVELFNAGHEAITVDDLSNGKIDVVDRIREICGRNPSFYSIDCANTTKAKNILGCEAVYTVEDICCSSWGFEKTFELSLILLRRHE